VVAASSLPPEELADYLTEMGGVLVSYGCPAYRSEEVVRIVAEREGYGAQVFAIPTGMLLSLSHPDLSSPLLRMIRVKDWGMDLDRLTLVDAIFNDVIEHRITIEKARQKLHELAQRPPPYSANLRLLATALASGSMAVFLRGSAIEVVAAAVTGVFVGVLTSFLRKNTSGRLLGDFLGSLLAGVMAWGLTFLRPDLSREVVVLSGILTLLPGMTLTTGLGELAYKNLVSGSAKLMEAFMGFLLILSGIALAIAIEQLSFGKPGGVMLRGKGMDFPIQLVALLAASFAAGVNFSLPRRYLWTTLFSSGAGWLVILLGARRLPSYLVAFFAALVLSLFANIFARSTQRPAQLVQLPGMLLLVPGSFGVLSLEAFLRGEFLGGAAKGFEMILTAGALVTGILLANVVLPAKKIL